jgi:predicted type IV restriction endonuclease
MSSEEMFKTPPAKSEFVTRKQIVDRRLRDAGWKIVRFDEAKALAAYERCAIEEYPTENGPAESALCVGGKLSQVFMATRKSFNAATLSVRSGCTCSSAYICSVDKV